MKNILGKLIAIANAPVAFCIAMYLVLKFVLKNGVSELLLHDFDNKEDDDDLEKATPPFWFILVFAICMYGFITIESINFLNTTP